MHELRWTATFGIVSFAWLGALALVLSFVFLGWTLHVNRQPAAADSTAAAVRFRILIGSPASTPCSCAHNVGDLVHKAIRWRRWRLLALRVPLTAAGVCLTVTLITLAIFGHHGAGTAAQFRDQVALLAIGYTWAAMVWAIPAHFGEMSPRLLLAARILAIARLTSRHEPRLVTDDLLVRLTRLRRRLALYFLVQHGTANPALAAAHHGISTRLDAAAARLLTDPVAGRDQLGEGLWLAMAAVAMDPAGLHTAASAIPALGDGQRTPHPDRRAINRQRFIALLPIATIASVALAAIIWVLAPGLSPLLTATIPAAIAAGTAITVAYWGRQPAQR